MAQSNIVEGKTKIITPGPKTGTVMMLTKDELTGGDAAKKAHIAGIAAHKVTQTANVFSLLQREGIPVAFIERVDPTTLLCADCEMIPLELVARRYAWGSFLKREPAYVRADGKPHRFERVVVEFFHKAAVVLPPLVDKPQQMEEGVARSRFLKDGVWAKEVYTDPYVHIADGSWALFSAKAPLDPSKSLLEISPMLTEVEKSIVVDELVRPCFAALERAWGKVETVQGPVALADLKIEVGRRKTDGVLVIADVIDNDSWRIWPGADPNQQLDKQNFRDGKGLEEVADNYALVAKLTASF